MKKILHVIASANPESGGPIHGISELYTAMKKKGWDNECVTCDSPKSDWISYYPFKIHALGPKVLKYSFSKKIKNWIINNEKNYDLIIINGIWSYVSYATWQALLEKQRKYVIFTHGMLDPWFKVNYPFKHYLKKLPYWWLIENKVLRDASFVMFTCEEERFLARNSFNLYKVNELVINYGITSAPTNSHALKQNFLAKYPDLIGKKIFLFLSRIHEKKGCDLVIHAFSKMAMTDPNLHLIIAGPSDENMSIKLKKLASDQLISNKITWTGMLLDEYKWGAYYSADAFCLPSHQENFGIVVAEALSCGLPVLISNKVNIWREIELSGAGIVQDDNIEGTIVCMERWLKLSSIEQQKMREAAVKCFEKNFEIENYVEKIIKISEELS